MRLFYLITATSLGLIFMDHAASAGGKAGKNTELQGSWIVESLVKYGQPFKEAVGDKLTVDGDKLFIAGQLAFRLRLDPTAKPKHFDAFQHKGSKLKLHGIYKMEGNTLTICCTDAGTNTKAKLPERPREFASPACTPIILFVLKRARD